MGLKIYWTYFSKTQLQNIFLYHKEKAGIKVAKKLILGITQEVLLLQNNLALFLKEELLKDRLQDFRYLVFENYKIIYFVNTEKNRIEIVDIFDCRQNPIKIKRTK